MDKRDRNVQIQYSGNPVLLKFTEWRSGDLNPDETPPIVFLHGAGISGESIVTYALESFVQQGSKWLIVLNWPGYTGSSKIRGRHTIHAYNEVLLSFLDTYGISRCHVIGVSMGASVALSFTAAHPEKVLTVCVQGAIYHGEAQIRARVAWWTAPLVPIVQMLANLPDPLLHWTIKKATNHGWVVRKWGRKTNPLDLQILTKSGDEYVELLVEMMEHSSFRVRLENGLDAANCDIREELQQICKPTLFTDGDGEQFLPADSLNTIAQFVPKEFCEVMLIPDAGHLAHLTNPQFFAREVVNFIQRHSNS